MGILRFTLAPRTLQVEKDKTVREKSPDCVCRLRTDAAMDINGEQLFVQQHSGEPGDSSIYWEGTSDLQSVNGVDSSTTW